MERVLQKSTDTVAKSLIFGMATTTMMQSSTLVSVISISFMSARLLELAAGQVSFENALSLAIGANVGTTVTAVLESMRVKRFAIPHPAWV